MQLPIIAPNMVTIKKVLNPLFTAIENLTIPLQSEPGGLHSKEENVMCNVVNKLQGKLIIAPAIPPKQLNTKSSSVFLLDIIDLVN
ncbi:MAG: hypothetical protein AAF298_21955 [Cyanobacteria bacterium P01_A01_bin.40]